MTARSITDFLHSRPGARLICLAELLLIAGSYVMGSNRCPDGVVPSLNGWAGAGCALTLTVAVMAMLRLLNKQFNLMRHDSSLGTPIFAAMTTSLPWVATTLWPGWMLPVMLLIVGYLLFTSFSDPTSTRTIYQIFTLTTASAFIVPQSLFFLPILLIGCAQMRILTLRVVIAAILGIITPGWIAIGFDLCEPADLPLPTIEFASDIFSQTLVEPQTLASVAVIALLGLIAMGANLYKLLSYNAVTRATNGFLTILFMSTLLLLIVDFINMTVYLPLLITLASYQVTLFLVTRRTDRGWIAIVTVMVIFWGLFFWNLWTSLPSATA